MKHKYTPVHDTPILIRAKKAYLNSSDVSIQQFLLKYPSPFNASVDLMPVSPHSCATKRPSSQLKDTTTPLRMPWTLFVLSVSEMTSARSVINISQFFKCNKNVVVFGGLSVSFSSYHRLDTERNTSIHWAHGSPSQIVLNSSTARLCETASVM